MEYKVKIVSTDLINKVSSSAASGSTVNSFENILTKILNEESTEGWEVHELKITPNIQMNSAKELIYTVVFKRPTLDF